MNVYFTDIAKKELDYWIKSDRPTALKIYGLISDIKEHGVLGGRGKPEKLKHFKNPPKFSRHITKGDRLVYGIKNKDDLIIFSCKGHYDNI